MTFDELNEVNLKLMHIRLDFEEEELKFRQDIWHERITKLL